MRELLARVREFPLADGTHLDVEVEPGEIIRIVGPNGSGKTSLLRSMAGLSTPVKPVHAAGYPAGFATQNAMDCLIGLTVAGEFRLRGLDDARTPIDANRDVATLSAGEARRVAIETALQQGPLVLLDEPSEGLDAGSRKRLAKDLVDAAQRGRSIVVVDHGDHWADIAHRTVELGAPDQEEFPTIAKHGGKPVLRHQGDLRVGSRIIRAPPLELGPGFHVLVGPNGCGKTQLLQRLRDKAPMLPADARSILTHDTVHSELEQAAGGDPALERLANRHPWTLSGGERQRLALRKVFGCPGKVILLDEPEAHLDAAGRRLLHQLVADRVARGACVLAATHDVGLIQAAHSVTVMEAP